MPPPYFVWQALAGQGWPATHDQEKALVENLRRAAAGHGDPTRTATTALLNALRCGVSFERLQETLPTLNHADVLSAYDYLDERLNAAARAWRTIVADPSPEVLEEHGDCAALLLPVPVERVRVVTRNVRSDTHIRRSVDAVHADVLRVSASAAHVEDRLVDLPDGSPVGIKLGRSLHDVSEPGLWTHPHLLPARVGQLSTTRVADLRHERT